MDVECKFHAVAYFPDIVLPQLLLIEKNCLAATKLYAKRLKEKPNNESRYGIEPSELWKICSRYFPENAIIYDNHANILALNASDHDINEEIDDSRDRQYTKVNHFNNIRYI
jgi:hypothetical protein